VLIAFFVVNVFGVITSVTVSSFATRWLGTWLPSGWTPRWYAAAWAEFQLDEVLHRFYYVMLLPNRKAQCQAR
jgi:putative spermidine/putrescine transport system permease protein